jgi:microcystin-dependent protein
MSQFDFGTIDPFVVDGVQLAGMLNSWRDALYSSHRGPAPPAYAVPGIQWIDDAGGATNWIFKVLASPGVWVSLYRLNTTTGTIELVNTGIYPGTVLDFAGDVPPPGFLLCEGQTVSRVTYGALFDAIGIKYGAGDGTTTFGVPDLRGRVTAGKDTATSPAGRITIAGVGIDGTLLGAAGGTETHTLTVAQMPAHPHTITDPAHNHPPNGGSFLQITTGDNVWVIIDGGSSYATYYRATTGNRATGITVNSAGGGGAHPNVQATMIMNKMIKT